MAANDLLLTFIQEQRMPRELRAEQLRRRFDPSRFDFQSTADATDLAGIIGQDRAARAIEFGLEIPYPGFNVFATGPTGSGKTSIITRFLQDKAAARPVPPDWGYAHNFAEPDRPLALELPPGGGVRLREQVNALLAQAGDLLDKLFVSDQYVQSRNALGRQLDQMRGERFRALDAVVRERGFVLARKDDGFLLTPLKDGQAVTPEQYDALPEAERDAINETGQGLQEQMERTLRQVQDLEEAARARLADMDRELAAATLHPLFDRLNEEYKDWPKATEYLHAMHAHISANTRDFRMRGEERAAGEPPDDTPAWMRPRPGSPFDRYRLNVLVDNSGLTGAPVVVETNPTYANLIGRVEMRAQLGTLVTDYRYIKPGALHRANGGYLLLDARILLRQPGAWDALKQALRNRRIRIEDALPSPAVLATTTLNPEPIPLDLKVVLIGDLTTYYALYNLDEQFSKLFKVRADFNSQMDWTAENEHKIVQFIRNRCDELGLPQFDMAAVAEVIEASARIVEDQDKLTTRFALVTDLIQEAAFWAIRAGRPLVTREDVVAALAAQKDRSNQYEERMQEMIGDGTIMVDTTGEEVGQVNGLAVLDLGDYAFGRPNRITATTFQGRAGVINIEREARMSGRVHDKGVLILVGFLGGRYAQDKPLSLTASITFEQSYDGVDGDSASSTELYALMSSLAELPVKQGIAVTGSVNQLGEIQPVGGVTQKVEGFFDTCKRASGGLTGEQGVILPASNVGNLMLRDDVVEAVAQGKFHIWPVATVDEGIEILTGVAAGARTEDGTFPEDSVNGRVDRKLFDLADQLTRFGQTNGNGRDRAHRHGEPPSSDEPPLPGDQPEPAPPEPELPGDRPEELLSSSAIAAEISSSSGCSAYPKPG
jgi:lon-related putative ATP-dependent protease